MVQLAAIVILIANLVVIMRLGVEALVVSPRSLPYLLPVLGSGLFLGLVGTLFQWRSLATQSGSAPAGNLQPDRNPFSTGFWSAIRRRAVFLGLAIRSWQAARGSMRWRLFPA